MAETTKLVQARTLNGDFARYYKYSFIFTPQSNADKLKEIIELVDGNLADLLSTSCLQVQIPAGGSQEITVDVGLHTLRLPGRKDTPGSITPEFLISGNYALYKFFRRWANICTSYKSDTQYASSRVLADISIFGFDVEGTRTQNTKLLNVWCRNCPEISYNDSSNDVVKFSPELAYELVDDNFSES